MTRRPFLFLSTMLVAVAIIQSAVAAIGRSGGSVSNENPDEGVACSACGPINDFCPLRSDSRGAF